MKTVFYLLKRKHNIEYYFNVPMLYLYNGNMNKNKNMYCKISMLL